MQTSGFKSSEINPHALKATKLSFQIMQLATNLDNQIPRPPSQAATSNQSSTFTFIQLFSGRAGVAGDPSNKTTFFLSLPKIRSLSLLPALSLPYTFLLFPFVSFFSSVRPDKLTAAQ
jgi:hypothetical protein